MWARILGLRGESGFLIRACDGARLHTFSEVAVLRTEQLFLLSCTTHASHEAATSAGWAK